MAKINYIGNMSKYCYFKALSNFGSRIWGCIRNKWHQIVGPSLTVASATSTIEILLLFDSLTDSHLCPENLCTVWVIPLYADVIYGSPQNWKRTSYGRSPSLSISSSHCALMRACSPPFPKWIAKERKRGEWDFKPHHSFPHLSWPVRPSPPVSLQGGGKLRGKGW